MSPPGMLETVTVDDAASPDSSFGPDVVAFRVHPVPGHGHPGPMVNGETLAAEVSQLAEEVTTVVLLNRDEATAGEGSARAEATIAAMLAQYRRSEVDALVGHVVATEAVKRVDGDVVVGGVERSALVGIGRPEIIDRGVVSRVLAEAADRAELVSPIALVVAAGGVVGIFDESGPDRR